MIVQKSKSAAYLLLFATGWFGGHHFYLRDTILGWASVLLCWTGLPLLLCLMELPTLHRRVRRVNRLQLADYHGQVDPRDIPQPICRRCHRHIGWIIRRSQGRAISSNHQLVRWSRTLWRELGLIPPAYQDPHNRDLLCPSCSGEIPPVASQEAPEVADRPNVLRLGTGTLLLLIGLPMLYHGALQAGYHLAHMHLQWKATPGVITYNAVDQVTHHERFGLDSRVSYQPQVQFRYVWQGQRWSMGGSLAQEPPYYPTREAAQAYLKRHFPIGQVITARVNPEDAEQAYAMVRTGHNLPMALLGLVLIFGGGVLIVSAPRYALPMGA
uniref:Uncharacterized protein n=1 Tax=Magnetococcus massalia (strain MO-1) TaxID=451514 RepID=A0A1S7LIY7_MAGMO|nr:conserved membrane protein of unknown function [Candidatus Magnetococcus massalia]